MMAARTTDGLRGELAQNIALDRYTSWRVGGRAARVYRPADRDDLCRFLAGLDPAEPLLWIGLGSNLLVRDGGFPGTVIVTQGRVREMRAWGEHGIEAECGVACAQIARHAARANLVGGEFFAGIPGTLGGALAMNAGAFGGETWSIVAGVDTVDRRGVVHTREPAEFSVGYRQVQGPPDEWFLAARLALSPGDGAASRDRIRSLLERRAATQPTGLPSCGSVFRNPPGDHAARLIEAAGLKGLRRGAAEVSPRHANFIINTGGATAADIEALIGEVRERVNGCFGVLLEPEVRIVGEAAAETAP